MNDAVAELKAVLESNGFASLSDLFIAHPTLGLVTASDFLNKKEKVVAPVDLEKTLRDESKQRNDFHFFARVVLFTALTGNAPYGWTPQHYLLFGNWVTMLGDGYEDFASRCWDRLQEMNIEKGWQPTSIFDPILDEVLKRGESEV